MDIINCEQNKTLHEPPTHARAIPPWMWMEALPVELRDHINDTTRITNTLKRKTPWQKSLINPNQPAANIRSKLSKYIVTPKY